jgi:hypothetical protein
MISGSLEKWETSATASASTLRYKIASKTAGNASGIDQQRTPGSVMLQLSRWFFDDEGEDHPTFRRE